MKLKRMAIVAAAAVVGPTVLMATPAMADEVQNPAITTPDAAPKDDSAGAAATPAPAPAPVATTTPAAEAPAPAADAAKPAVETPAPTADAVKPATETPAPATEAAKPAAETPAAKAGAQTPAAKASGEAVAEDAGEWVATGPKLAIKDLPSSFKPGGGWQEFTLEVDNAGGQDLKDYSLGVSLLTRTTRFKEGYIALEVYLPDAKGNWKWWPADVSGTEDAFGVDFGSGSISKGDKFDIKLRLKFSGDAPETEFAVVPSGWSNTEEIYSDGEFARAEIKAGSNGGGSNGGGHTGGGHTGGGNDTKPNGGGTTTPIVDHHTGTGSTGTGTAGSTTNAGGQLAETGTDAATSWALGAGGAALAMGAALVAGTGRRRRVGA
ncbi:hypothetical protein [Streptomyces sp. NPDC048551]|uniref:hypothetical protein n=1 Tax=Streptomyces sp. NPDC048551 TaxID=3155758 RepID=UPI0034128E39